MRIWLAHQEETVRVAGSAADFVANEVSSYRRMRSEDRKKAKAVLVGRTWPHLADETAYVATPPAYLRRTPDLASEWKAESSVAVTDWRAIHEHAEDKLVEARRLVADVTAQIRTAHEVALKDLHAAEEALRAGFVSARRHARSGRARSGNG